MDYTIQTTWRTKLGSLSSGRRDATPGKTLYPLAYFLRFAVRKRENQAHVRQPRSRGFRVYRPAVYGGLSDRANCLSRPVHGPYLPCVYSEWLKPRRSAPINGTVEPENKTA